MNQKQLKLLNQIIFLLDNQLRELMLVIKNNLKFLIIKL